MLVLINILEAKISKIDAYYVNMQKGYLNVHRYKAFLKVVESGAYGEVEEAFAAAGIVRAAKQV